jgi:hypothetical protein
MPRSKTAIILRSLVPAAGFNPGGFLVFRFPQGKNPERGAVGPRSGRTPRGRVKTERDMSTQPGARRHTDVTECRYSLK